MVNTVLVATDDRTVAQQLRTALEAEGMTVLCANSAGEMLSLLDSEACDLTILQMNLSGVPGVELARICQQRTGAVMFLLDTGTLDAAALKELAHELHEMMEHEAETETDVPHHLLHTPDWQGDFAGDSQQEEKGCLILGDLTLHLDRHCVSVGDKRASLTPMQTQILKVLIEHSPRVIPPELLAERIRPNERCDLSKLAAGISALRNLLHEVSPATCLIRHVAGYGFSIRPEPQP